MNTNFTDKTALVTGGATGIGLAITRKLLEMGMQVVITSRREELLKHTSEKLGCDYFSGDITDLAVRKKLVNYVLSKYNSLSVLVNSAGVFIQGNIENSDEGVWDRTFDLNVKALYLLTREFIPHFKEQDYGYIINISSHAGKRGLPNSSVYCASKFAVMGINDSLNAELRDTSIRVSAICPGYVATPMTENVDIPPETMIQPEDIANAVYYLLNLSSHAWTREIIIERLA